MDIFAKMKADVLAAVETVLGDVDTKNVTVEPPKDFAHGDMATNAAMVLAKSAGEKPRDLAEKLAKELETSPMVAALEIAGPGFLNIRLKPEIYSELIAAVLADGQNYGRADIGAGKAINVEFVSANPTGPIHVGHTRGAVVGDAIASLLDFIGYDVTREYYINDGGAQVDTLARSVYLRYLEALGHEVQFADGTYPGDYLKPVGAGLAEEYGDRFENAPESEWLGLFRERATDAMLALIKSDLAALGVKMDVFFSEKSLYGTGKIEAAIDTLAAKGLIYEGTLSPPKGQENEDWEPRVQTLFKSTEYGDDVDRPIKKADGSWTYFAPDIAYHYDKIERGFSELIDILGADHGGYVKRMKAAVAALSGETVPLDIKLCQIVKLFKNGEPFVMSKRAGNFILLSDLIDEVGPDVTRFVMLTRKNDVTLDFDFDKVREQSKDNPVFYVHYASARANSVLRKARDVFGDVTDDMLAAADRSLLTLPHEQKLLRVVAEWPRLVKAAAEVHEPHRVAFYLNELASAFHAAQHVGKIEPDARFIAEDNKALSFARLSLVRAVECTIETGFGILGVTALKEMR